MIKSFPGRTLEELDTIDWPRYMRAVAAVEMDRIEEKKASVLAKYLEPKQVSPKDWESIQEHDALIEEDEETDEE